MRCRRWTPFLALALLAPAPTQAQEHLRFFHANRDFVLRALERLPLPGEPGNDAARAWDFDPFVEWSAAAAIDSARQRLDGARTPEDLAAFNTAVGDLLEQASRAGARLDDLEDRFAVYVRTALEVTLATPQALHVARVEAWLDDAGETDHVLSASETAALQAGGVLEVVRRVVEPRDQDLRVHVWIAGRDAPVVLETRVQPQPDRVLRLQLDIERPDAPIRVAQSTFGGSH